MEKSSFSSRMGFLLISAGCAIGLGNVWRFPYVVGQNGGAVFVLIYLIFLVILGLPIMVMELAVGRGSGGSIATAFTTLAKEPKRWKYGPYFVIGGNYLVMMFYTTIGGWTLYYVYKTLVGSFQGCDAIAIQGQYKDMLSRPFLMLGCMALAVGLSFFICSLGVQKGVEAVTKWMLLALFALMIILAIRSVLLPGSTEGLRFFLYPSLSKLQENGLTNTIYAAMSQAFFTLSLGMGSLTIFGSYTDKKHSLSQEALTIMLLDTAVALLAGLIIFPSCFASNINPKSGPELIFITLPVVFNQMSQGRFWGTLFFLCMAFAAISTIVAVFESLIAYCMEITGHSRRRVIATNLIAILILSTPCVLGFNVFRGFHPLGVGTSILDLEDFIVSGFFLPLGSLFYLLFCTNKKGWGCDSFLLEANTGKGIHIPKRVRLYLQIIMPIIILYIFVQGLINQLLS